MRIMLADANPEVRTALRLVLEHQETMVIIGEARDAINLFAQVAHFCPDVVLLDPDLPGLVPTGKRLSTSSLSELINTLHLLCPTICVIGLSSRPDSEKDCLQAKMDAFACKSDPPDDLIKILINIVRK